MAEDSDVAVDAAAYRRSALEGLSAKQRWKVWYLRTNSHHGHFASQLKIEISNQHISNNMVSIVRPQDND